MHHCQLLLATSSLGRLLQLHRIYFTKPRPEDLMPLEGALLKEVQSLLRKLGYYQGTIGAPFDEATRAALFDYAGMENLEERLPEGASIDRVVLQFLRQSGNPA